MFSSTFSTHLKSITMTMLLSSLNFFNDFLSPTGQNSKRDQSLSWWLLSTFPILSIITLTSVRELCPNLSELLTNPRTCFVPLAYNFSTCFILKSYSTPKAQIKILTPPWRPPWWYPLSVRTSLLEVCVPVTIKLHIYWYILLIVHVYVHVHVYQGTIHKLHISESHTGIMV